MRLISTVAIALALLASLQVKAETGTPTSHAPAELKPVPWTPILVQPSDAPRAVRGSDGMYNLVYDVLLTNYNRHAARLKEFKVLGNGRSICSLKDADLLKNFTALDSNKDGELAPGTSGILWVNISFDKKEEIPQNLLHQITFESTDALNDAESFSYQAAPLKVDERGPVVVGAPLKGGRWYAFGGYADHTGHRTALFPINNELISAQRFAIDWISVDKNNHFYMGDGQKIDNWFCYGEPVLAVAEGTVYGVLDKFPDQEPFKPAGSDRLSYPAGNCIVLDLGNCYYGVYAHLKPGSIQVRAGDKVKRGQEIALVGNSGNTDGPHLHFHIIDAPGVLAAHGVPYVFDNFLVDGEVTNPEQAEKTFDNGLPVPVVVSKFKGTHEQELPKSGTVIVFPPYCHR